MGMHPTLRYNLLPQRSPSFNQRLCSHNLLSINLPINLLLNRRHYRHKTFNNLPRYNLNTKRL